MAKQREWLVGTANKRRRKERNGLEGTGANFKDSDSQRPSRIDSALENLDRIENVRKIEQEPQPGVDLTQSPEVLEDPKLQLPGAVIPINPDTKGGINIDSFSVDGGVLTISQSNSPVAIIPFKQITSWGADQTNPKLLSIITQNDVFACYFDKASDVETVIDLIITNINQ